MVHNEFIFVKILSFQKTSLFSFSHQISLRLKKCVCLLACWENYTLKTIDCTGWAYLEFCSDGWSSKLQHNFKCMVHHFGNTFFVLLINLLPPAVSREINPVQTVVLTSNMWEKNLFPRTDTNLALRWPTLITNWHTHTHIVIYWMVSVCEKCLC